MNFTKIRPLMNRVVVKRLQMPTQTSGGILLPTKNDTQKIGMITEVGPGRVNSAGVMVKTTLIPGEYVLLPDYGGVKVPKSADGNEECTIYQEEDILGVVNKI